MRQAIFARGSNDRKPAFQLITVIKRVEGKFLVSKQLATPEANKHLKSFKTKYGLLAGSGADCSIAKIISSSKNEIGFEYINGGSLQARFEKYINLNDFQGVKSVLDRVFTLIDSFPVVNLNPSLNKDYGTIFGNSFNSPMECIAPVCIDLNLDNLFCDKKDRLTLIDYEWVYAFAVPKDFLKLRVLKSAFTEVLTNFLKSFPELEVTSYNDEFVIPTELEKLYKINTSGVDKFIRSNTHFLDYIQNSSSHTPHKRPVRTQLLARDLLKKISESNGATNARLRQQEEYIRNQDMFIKEQIGIIQSLESQLSQVRRTITHRTVGRAELKLRRNIRKHI